jgi:hypothetical protein
MPANRNWAITFQEKQKYDLIFKANDTDNVGFIAGDKARIVFAQSGLHENMLAHIWSLCDMQNRGKLNSDEFAVAMHLIYQKLNGQDLPRKLPENLIPPSHKELSALTNFAKLDALQQQPVRRISPASSLMGLANILPTPAANVSNVMPEDQEQKKQELLAQVEQKRLELAKLKESTGIRN